MLAIAAATNPAVLPAIIAAASSLLSGLVVAVVAWRAQSAKEQLDEIRKIVETTGDATAAAVKEAIRDVIGSHPQKRRWYE